MATKSTKKRSVAKKTVIKSAKIQKSTKPTRKIARKEVSAAKKNTKKNTKMSKADKSTKPSKKVAPPVPPAPPEAVGTSMKARKNQAGLHVKDLEHYRDLLLAKRRELVGDMSSMEREALRTSGSSNLSNLPIHMADMGTDNYEQEFTLGLMEKDRQILRDINSSLGKIQNGTYGLCEGTGKPISKARLEAQPWARYSIEYARKMEKTNPIRHSVDID